MTQQKWNDPKKVDSGIGWIILLAVGGAVFLALGRNFAPYANAIEGAMRNAGPILGILSWLPGIGLGFGGLIFVGVQLGEVQPLRLLLSRHLSGKAFDRALVIYTVIALICFGIDLSMCMWAWPPVNLPGNINLLQVIQAGAFTWAMLNWGNAIQIFGTLFGLTIFLIAEHWIKRDF